MRLSIEEVQRRLKERGFELVDRKKYVNTQTKTAIRCHCGKVFYTIVISIFMNKTKSCGHCNDPEIGDRFGKLTITEVIPTNVSVGCSVVCKCDCGNTLGPVICARIKNGNTKSCGHCNDAKVGDRFGKLTVIKVIPARHKGCMVVCKCDCKNVVGPMGFVKIKCGNTKSCGHCNDPKVGDKFGKLTITEVIPSPTNGCSVVCKCGCGSVVGPMKFVRIKSGHIKSCGHCDDPQIGDKFGKLTITEVIPCKTSGCRVICKCDCGNVVGPISSYYIRCGDTKSCGHCNDPKVGDKFEKLTITEVIPSKTYGCRIVCKCDCGNVVGPMKFVRIKSGHTKSCGKCNVVNIGDRFGKLEVVMIFYNKSGGGASVVCQCDCGKDTGLIYNANLLNGNNRSCGNCGNFRNGKMTSFPALQFHDMVEEWTGLKWEHNYDVAGFNWDICNSELKIAIEFSPYYTHRNINNGKDLEDRKKEALLNEGWKLITVWTSADNGNEYDDFPQQYEFEEAIEALKNGQKEYEIEMYGWVWDEYEHLYG